jgi:hypothetical protein
MARGDSQAIGVRRYLLPRAVRRIFFPTLILGAIRLLVLMSFPSFFVRLVTYFDFFVQLARVPYYIMYFYVHSESTHLWCVSGDGS